MSFQAQVYQLLEDQRVHWGLLKKNYTGLKHVRTRSFDFGHFRIDLQYNPERIVSSAAKVDPESIRERSCFLCSSNRPPEQVAVAFEKEYEILCNPFPIFNDHLTIAKREHQPQLIANEFETILRLSSALPGMVLFYNGPNCGASAPDHMHFQAGNLGLMPLESDFDRLSKTCGHVLCNTSQVNVISVDDGLRRFITIAAADENAITRVFMKIYERLAIDSNDEEPMMNVLVYFSETWRVHVFPREKHRPRQYFADGEDNILFSPASVDMGGTLILPLERDFEKVTIPDIRDMFSQVSVDRERFDDLGSILKAGCSSQ
jgi:ATP adenylyltransferase/5',5'''-P-1,P-4-tetraphosphate phosphorylase II